MANPPSGLSAQLGIVDESTYGTLVTVSRFYEFINETVKQDIARLESRGLRAGTRTLRSSQWVPGAKKPAGDVEMELANKNFGLIFKHMFGAIASSQPDVGGNPTVWEHNSTPGDLTGKSFSMQIGRPDQGATVRPFTYSGCKVGKWELDCKINEIPKLKLSIIAQDETTATSLAAASYPTSPQLFVFTQGTLTVGGSGVDIQEITLAGDNKLSEDRLKLGAAVRKEPLETDFRDYTATITEYFSSLTDYNRFINGTEAALVLSFVGSVISTTYNFTITITANVRFDGDTPQVSGPQEIMQPLKIKAIDAGSGAISLLFRTTDTAP